MKIGYDSAFTDDQATAVSVTALKAGGCERIFREKACGGRWDRPELQQLLDQLRRAPCCWSENVTGCLVPSATYFFDRTFLGNYPGYSAKIRNCLP